MLFYLDDRLGISSELNPISKSSRSDASPPAVSFGASRVVLQTALPHSTLSILGFDYNFTNYDFDTDIEALS